MNNMTNFVNVQIPPEYLLDPKLAELVDKLALRNPTHTYGTKGMNAENQAGNSGLRPLGVSGRVPEREDGLRYLRKITVYYGSELLGTLSLDIRYGRSSGTEVVYSIKSWRINNERGTHNLTRTAKLDSALRSAKAAFVPQNVDELMHKADEQVSGALMQALSDLKRPITHSTLVRSHIALQKYVFYALSSEEMPASLKHEVETCFTSDKYKAAMAEYELAKHMADIPMRTIRAHNGGYLMRVDDLKNKGRTVKHFAYDELPEKVQSNIAVLQLMQDGELVYDVGFRFNADCFAIPEN